PSGGHEGAVSGLTASPDSKTIATQAVGAVRFWNAATGQLIRQLDGGKRSMTSPVFTPDGLTVVYVSAERILGWDVQSGKPIVPPPFRDPSADLIEFSRDGHTLLLARRRQVELRDWPSGRRRCTVELFQDPAKPGQTQC